MKPSKKIGVVLTGGGARGAYQAGVLRGVCEIASKTGCSSPFHIFSGISVGAINAAFLASHATNFLEGSYKLSRLWADIRTNQVIETGPLSLGSRAVRWFMELMSGKIIKEKKSRSLLDNSPLGYLLSKKIDFRNIQSNIANGYLESFSVTALNYSDGLNYNFYETNQKIEPWVRAHRIAVKTEITLDHILASSALPLYFPPQKLGKHYFADGNIRNFTPLSPAIRLGADKLLIIPARQKPKPGVSAAMFDPTLGRMITVLLDTLLFDAIDFDFERLSRINETLRKVPEGKTEKLRQLDVCMIRPSEDLAHIAVEESKNLPGSLQYMMQGLGSPSEAEGLISILLFEPSYTQRLIALGYHDALRREEEITSFLFD